MTKPVLWSRSGAIAGVIALISCAGGKAPNRDSTAAAVRLDTNSSSRIAAASTGKEPCPATGLWAECSAFQALDRAGLAPRRDSTTGAVHMDPLTQPGARILLGGSQLDVFIYPSEADRARDEARLDKHQFIEAADEPTLRGEPTLIRNVNLLAILHSRNDHQRERVSDALTAGPPQASHATPIPGSKTR
jgi:hypothetical protein